MASIGQLSSEETRKVVHDLRGPVVCIEGFSQELEGAADQMRSLVERHRAELPGDFIEELSTLLATDLEPCLRFLKSATSQLETRLGEVNRFAERDDRQPCHRAARPVF